MPSNQQLLPFLLDLEESNSACQDALVVWCNGLSVCMKTDDALLGVPVYPIQTVIELVHQDAEQTQHGTERRGIDHQRLFVQRPGCLVALHAEWLIL